MTESLSHWGTGLLIDSHTHLISRRYAEVPPITAEALITQAQAAGVGGMLGIAVTPAEWQPYATLCADNTSDHFKLWMAAGLHPNHVHEATLTHPQLTHLADQAQYPHLIALGECGLDYHYGTDLAVQAQQRHVFIQHCVAALETGLPLVVHTRDAEADTLAILADHPVPFVLHCFTGTEAMARTAIERGGYLSFSGVVTFKNSHALRAIVAATPAQQFLIETDAPYLAPEPVRSQRNQPAHVAHVAACVAQVRGTTPTVIAQQTSTNFAKLFPRATLGA